MNAPLEQLRTMKGPQCVWSIPQDVGQGLRMLETFLLAATMHLWPGGKNSKQLRHVYLCLFKNFAHNS